MFFFAATLVLGLVVLLYRRSDSLPHPLGGGANVFFGGAELLGIRGGLFLQWYTALTVNIIPVCKEARPRERSDRGRFLPIGKKASSYRGAYRVPLFN